MIVWWRPEPLSPGEGRLVTELLKAHHLSTFRANPSTIAIQMATAGNGGNYFQSMCAALMMVGGRHGPLTETYDFLSLPDPGEEARSRLAVGEPVYGWGNSFEKGKLDPILEPVDRELRKFTIYDTVEKVQKVMDSKGLYPNPSCYTAATAITLGIPRESTPWLAVHCRLASWAIVHQGAVEAAKGG